MAVDIQAFTPASSYTISATAVTSNTALTQVAPTGGSAGQAYGGGNAGGYTRIKCYNTSTSVVAYLQPGMAPAIATATSAFVLPPATWVTFDIGYPATNLAAIMASSGTVTLVVMLGNGY